MAALLLLVVCPSFAQDLSEISTDTRLRKEPEGTPLVSLPAGAEVESKRARGDWREVEVEGWIFTSSTAPTRRDGFDLVVNASEGENLRSEPNGEIVARVQNGTLLRKLEVRGGWTRVSRAGWVPSQAIASPVVSDTPRAPASTASPAPADTTPAPAPAPEPAERGAVARETPIYAAPRGGPYGTIQAGTPARVLGRSGEWVRVELEGWVRESDIEVGAGRALTGVTAAEVRSDPARYVGRTVEWRLQLIAVQTADELRPEMKRGQPYLLTRGPLPEPGFVYVMISPAQAAEFSSLAPLQELTLRVIVRAPKTRYLTTPVVELVSRVGSQ